MSAPHLQLTPKQHEQLARALATAHQIHSMVTGGALGDPNLGHDPMALAGILDMPIYVKGGAHGGGWWSDLGSTLKKGVKELQSSSVVRNLEKQAVSKGAAALRGVAEGALDDVAPEFAPLIDRGLSYVQKRGTNYLDDAIDKSGSGHCCKNAMCSGGGARYAMHTVAGSGGVRKAGVVHGGMMEPAGGMMRPAGVRVP